MSEEELREQFEQRKEYIVQWLEHSFNCVALLRQQHKK